MTDLIVLSAKYLYLLVILLAIVATTLAQRSIRNQILRLAIVTLPLALIIGKVAGFIYKNPRPFVVENITPLIPHAANNGFPSDHTLLTATLAAIIFRFNQKLGVLLGVLALIVGLSRMAVHVHHFVDILGSFVIAIASVYLSQYLLKKYGHRVKYLT